VLDMVNAAHHPDFALRLHALTPGDRQPSRREVVAAVEGWLSMFDWNEESKRVGEPGRPAQAIDLGGGWRLRGVPWPRPARGDRSFPTVVTNRLGVGVIDEPPTILDDLREKAGSYGRPARPFVIAVLCARDFATEHDIEQALYGPEVVRIPVGPDGPLPVAGEIDREPQGLWQRGEQQRATRVSAVLSAVLLDPWSIASVPLWLWLNPWAARPLVAGLPWGTVSGDLGANAIVRAEGQREPRDVLGLPEGWPRRAAA
jgi:hypothetical protein